MNRQGASPKLSGAGVALAGRVHAVGAGASCARAGLKLICVVTIAVSYED